MSRRTDLHVRAVDGVFCVFDGERFAEECTSEDAAHARLAELRVTRVRHVISDSALRGRDHITHATRDRARTLCGRRCSDWQEERPVRLDDPPDCLACSRAMARTVGA